MLAAFEPLNELRAIANRATRHVGIIRHIAGLLDTQSSSAQVKRVVRTYLNHLAEDAPRRGRGAVTGHFIDHIVGVSARYWPGLFHCYDDPRIPRTSNELEGSFGSSKRGVRQRTGRKSTSGGKIESAGEVVVRVEALLRVMSRTELEQHLVAVSPERYAQSKRRLRDVQGPARERRSIQRNLDGYLDGVLKAWLDPS